MQQRINCPQCGLIAQLEISYKEGIDGEERKIEKITCYHCRYRSSQVKDDNIEGGPC